MRRKKHAGERISACSEYLLAKTRVKSDNKTHLEIGCGKGDFICETAQKLPDINFIAVEKNQDVLVIALEKAKALSLPNVKFMREDAKNLAGYFHPGEISAIYLNFSDPWHKRYQKDKRLTAAPFLDIYKKFLAPEAKIILKTDNKNLFDYSLKTLPAHNFIITRQAYDLYNSDFFDPEANAQTEYEKKFGWRGWIAGADFVRPRDLIKPPAFSFPCSLSQTPPPLAAFLRRFR
jgi:tRNA (guanine-N7-)-methyltransferase